MFVYIIPVFVALCGVVQYDIGGHKGIMKKIIWAFLFVYLVLLMGLRYEVGGDTINYMRAYNLYDKDISSWIFTFRSEYQPLYTLMYAVAKTISKDFYVLQIIHAILFNGMLFYFIKRNTSYIFTALVVSFLTFYLYFSTEVMRESLAVLVFALSYNSIKEHKWFKYYFMVFIAFMFHMSAIVLLFIPFFQWIKYNKYYILILIVVSIFLLQFRDFISLFEQVGLLESKIANYRDVTFGGYLMTILNVVRYMVFPLLLCYIYKSVLKTECRYETEMCILALMGLGTIFSFIIFNRFTNYFKPFLAISIADIVCNLIKSYNIRNRLNAAIVCASVLLIYGSDFVHLSKYTLWVPYRSIYNKQHIERVYYNKYWR